MGFWIFMFVMVLILPVMLTGFGVWFQKHPPSEINAIYGYRTRMSMKNAQTWEFAHRRIGIHWRRAGLWLLPVSVLAMFTVVCQNETITGMAGARIMTLQCIALLLSVWQTEKELRAEFDSDGKKTGS